MENEAFDKIELEKQSYFRKWVETPASMGISASVGSYSPLSKNFESMPFPIDRNSD